MVEKEREEKLLHLCQPLPQHLLVPQEWYQWHLAQPVSVLEAAAAAAAAGLYLQHHQELLLTQQNSIKYTHTETRFLTATAN